MQILRKQHLSKCEYFVSMQKTDHPKNNEVLAPYTLNSILQHYFPEINFKNDIWIFFFGSNAKLKYRYLGESNYEYPILNSRLFKASRSLLGKIRLLHEKNW